LCLPKALISSRESIVTQQEIKASELGLHFFWGDRYEEVKKRVQASMSNDSRTG